MKQFEIKKEIGFPCICDRCSHKSCCYYLNEYGEATHCYIFLPLEEMTKELEGMIADVNINEISSHFTNGTLARWLNAWQNKTKEIIEKIKEMAEDEL